MKKIKKIVICGILAIPLIASATCREMSKYEIVTGSKTGTYFQIGKNLAKYVAPHACIKLKVINSNGSLDNVYKLISPDYPRLKFAIVQNDVLQELQRRADAGEVKSKKLVNSLRVIKPLYNEEIHILTKADSSIKNFGDLKGKKISIGKPKSGTAMTSMLLYKELFDEKLKGYTSESFDKSLRKLIRGEIDAIIKVAGQPVSRLSKGLKEGAGKLIKLISYDEKNSKHQLIQSYYTTDIYSKNYHWIKDDIPSLSTKAFLVTYNYKNIGTTNKIKKFVKSLNDNLKTLQKQATKSKTTPHLKWTQVPNECNPPLPGKWKYHKVVNEICPVNNPTINNTNKKSEECSSDDKTLGLCE